MRQGRLDARSELLARAAAEFAERQGAFASPRGDGAFSQSTIPTSREISFTLVNRKALIVFGGRLNLNDLATWNNVLWRCTDAHSVELDFGNVFNLTTLPMLFITHQVRAFYEKHPDVQLHAVHYHHLAYAAHVGFFDRLGAKFGKRVGEATGGLNYLPITSIDTRQFQKENGIQHVREGVESESRKLARMLIRTDRGFAYDTVQYSLREIIRNVFEHSNSKSVTYCAGYSSAKNRVELSIVDEGWGIHPSLTFNPRYKHLTERQSLQYSLMPGVSGNFRDLQGDYSDGTWRNSGYGLYMASRLCRNQGGFLIISSGYAIQLSKGKKHVVAVSNFRGTLITLNMTVSPASDLSAQLRRYAEEGKEYSQNIQGARVIEASAASQMLLRDFAK